MQTTLANGTTIFVPDPVPVVTPPIQPVDPPAIEPPPIDHQMVGPDDNWQAVVDAARPGDTIYFEGGDYRKQSDWNYSAALCVNVSGEPGKPITLRNVPGERPIFYGAHTWAIRIGYVDYRGPHDPAARGVHDVVLDGLSATQAPWDGFEVANSYNVVLRNCAAYANNYGSTNGYKAGTNIDAGHDITIDHCRVFDNGFGVCGYEHQDNGIEGANPEGPYNVTISNNFVYGNSRSANLGNSPGMDIRFATRCTYMGNIFYDNPDAGINGEGNNLCRVLNNICINQWQEPGNREGGKMCVRGGGGNVIAGNLFVNNDNCGWDATRGVGDVFINNTCYGNGSWGVLAEGSETMMFNNLLAGNSVRVSNYYPEMDALGWSAISDWNRFGRSPLVYTQPSPVIPFPANSSVGMVFLPGYPMARTDIRQVIHPEQAFGCSTVEEARAKVMAAYRPASWIPGDAIVNIQARCNSNMPAVLSALDAAIAAADASSDHQQHQAAYRYRQLKAQLTAYDLAGLPDGYIGAVGP